MAVTLPLSCMPRVNVVQILTDAHQEAVGQPGDTWNAIAKQSDAIHTQAEADAIVGEALKGLNRRLGRIEDKLDRREGDNRL